jgi:hypothetical protein
MYAHTQTILHEGLGPADCAINSNHCYFHYAQKVSNPCTRTNVKLLGPCFKTGERKPISQLPQHLVWTSRANSPRLLVQNITTTNDAATQCPPCKQDEKYGTTFVDFLCFSFSNFRYSLTLFSKFFASFPHGTCALSVSYPYLAFDGIYHRLELQSQTTRLFEGLFARQEYWGLTIHANIFQWISPGFWTQTSPHHNSVQQVHRFSSWATSRFSRPYSGNPSWFLFLHLIICLNSVGSLA